MVPNYNKEYLMSHTVFKNYKPELESKEGVWRSIVIDFNKGALKVSIDGIQILNIPNNNLSS